MPNPWVTRALDNDLPAQAYAGTAAFERAAARSARFECRLEAHAALPAGVECPDCDFVAYADCGHEFDAPCRRIYACHAECSRCWMDFVLGPTDHACDCDACVPLGTWHNEDDPRVGGEDY